MIDFSQLTEQQIKELAKTCGFDRFQRRNYDEDGDSDYGAYWECWEQELLKFALTIHEDGYNKGYEDGVNMMRNLEDYNDQTQKTQRIHIL